MHNFLFYFPDSILLLLPKLPCALKQWYEAHVYDLATEMARRKIVSYAIFYCTQEYTMLLLLCTLPRYLLSMGYSLVHYLVYLLHNWPILLYTVM